MMHHEAGVQTVVVGGQPQVLGPMQAVAGNRGARDYESDDLDIDSKCHFVYYNKKYFRFNRN